MEETFQLTGALKYLPFGKHVAVVTDARFSGVSTGACIGHVSPEALAGGPIGKLRDGDLVEIVVNRRTLDGTVNFVGDAGGSVSADEGARNSRGSATPRPDLVGRSGASGRHAHLGRASGRVGRHVGRSRVRRGPHP